MKASIRRSRPTEADRRLAFSNNHADIQLFIFTEMILLELNKIKTSSIYLNENAAWFNSKQYPRWELSNIAGGMHIYWPLKRCETNRWGPSERLYQATKYGAHVLCLPKS